MYIPEQFEMCKNVLIRRERIRNHLEVPYSAPFEELQGIPKYLIKIKALHI